MAKRPQKPKSRKVVRKPPRKAAPSKPRAPAEVRAQPTARLMEAMRPALGPEPVKVPRGRPSKYEERFCELLMEHMAGGFSFESFAGLIGVSKVTLYTWTKENADFLNAKERGSELARLWWEKLGIQGVQGLGPRVLAEENEEAVEVKGQPVFDAEGNPILKIKRKFAAAQFVPGTWFRNMTNRFPEEWRDRHEVTGKDGEPLLPPVVPWDTLATDPNVQAFMADRARLLGQAPGAAPNQGAGSAVPAKPARRAPKVEPVKPV